MTDDNNQPQPTICSDCKKTLPQAGQCASAMPSQWAKCANRGSTDLRAAAQAALKAMQSANRGGICHVDPDVIDALRRAVDNPLGAPLATSQDGVPPLPEPDGTLVIYGKEFPQYGPDSVRTYGQQCADHARRAAPSAVAAEGALTNAYAEGREDEAEEAMKFRLRIARLLAELHGEEYLSEQQCAKHMGIDLVSWRRIERTFSVGTWLPEGSPGELLQDNARLILRDALSAFQPEMPNDGECSAIAATPHPAPAVAAEAGQGTLTDEQVIARCKAAGINWVAPDEDPDGWPGGFDLTSLDDMRRLLSTQPAPPSQGLKAAALKALNVLTYPCSNGDVIVGLVEDSDVRAERDAILAALNALPEAAASSAQEPEYWQWRRKGEPWSLTSTFNSQVFATTPDSEVRALFAAPTQPPAEGEQA